MTTVEDIYSEAGFEITCGDSRAMLPVDEFMLALETVDAEDAEAIAGTIERLAKPSGFSLGKSKVVRAGRAYYIVGRLQDELTGRLKKKLNGSLTPGSGTSMASPQTS